MRYLIALPALLLLSACQSAAQRQASDDTYCKSIGATGNMYAQCMMQRDALAQQDRQARLARSAAMLSASAQIMSTPQPRPTTTTCRRVGQQVVCNTF